MSKKLPYSRAELVTIRLLKLILRELRLQNAENEEYYEDSDPDPEILHDAENDAAAHMIIETDLSDPEDSEELSRSYIV